MRVFERLKDGNPGRLLRKEEVLEQQNLEVIVCYRNSRDYLEEWERPIHPKGLWAYAWTIDKTGRKLKNIDFFEAIEIFKQKGFGFAMEAYGSIEELGFVNGFEAFMDLIVGIKVENTQYISFRMPPPEPKKSWLSRLFKGDKK